LYYYNLCKPVERLWKSDVDIWIPATDSLYNDTGMARN
jgi:hypothetical protein